MTAQKKQDKLKQDTRFVAQKFSPVTSQNGNKDFDEEAAQERRRQERLKRKKEERRDDAIEEEEPETLIIEAKKAKRKKKKKERPVLWVDDRYEDEADEIFEGNGRRKTRPNNEDWLGEWDE
jgi:hypothetical protein